MAILLCRRSWPPESVVVVCVIETNTLHQCFDERRSISLYLADSRYTQRKSPASLFVCLCGFCVYVRLGYYYILWEWRSRVGTHTHTQITMRVYYIYIVRTQKRLFGGRVQCPGKGPRTHSARSISKRQQRQRRKRRRRRRRRRCTWKPINMGNQFQIVRDMQTPVGWFGLTGKQEESIVVVVAPVW